MSSNLWMFKPFIQELVDTCKTLKKGNTTELEAFLITQQMTPNFLDVVESCMNVVCKHGTDEQSEKLFNVYRQAFQHEDLIKLLKNLPSEPNDQMKQLMLYVSDTSKTNEDIEELISAMDLSSENGDEEHDSEQKLTDKGQ